jgi:hypothetical protein
MTKECCRFCGTPLRHIFLDLGMSPLANSYLTADQLNCPEAFYPLQVFVCEACFLVQLQEFESPAEIFGRYAYFSSYSDSYVEHARRYADEMVQRFHLNSTNYVVEIASNDGYLLQHFVNKRIPVLGVEPAANVAEVARKRNIPTLVKFFGMQTASELVGEGRYADLLVGNNVFAHVPNLNDFMRGLKLFLNRRGVITLQFPHLMHLIAGNQFDTIYHEHFSYFSFLTVQKIFEAHGLMVFDVEELNIHGGSLRIYGCHADDPTKGISERVRELAAKEKAHGFASMDGYALFADRVQETKWALLECLITLKRKGKTVVAYGAAAKGNTLLNYAGIRSDFLAYTIDRSPHKQGHFLPGTHIPIYHPDKVRETHPNYVLILPWNLKDEIMEQMAYIKEWGGKFVVPIPNAQVLA